MAKELGRVPHGLKHAHDPLKLGSVEEDARGAVQIRARLERQEAVLLVQICREARGDGGAVGRLPLDGALRGDGHVVGRLAAHFKERTLVVAADDVHGNRLRADAGHVDGVHKLDVAQLERTRRRLAVDRGKRLRGQIEEHDGADDDRAADDVVEKEAVFGNGHSTCASDSTCARRETSRSTIGDAVLSASCRLDAASPSPASHVEREPMRDVMTTPCGAPVPRCCSAAPRWLTKSSVPRATSIDDMPRLSR